ncbi:hypothetical protein [Bacillus sp. Brlt_9]|uniref:hypothetical protein n=1 Tax=Bacillus sp. Brlt_9 TaxID=3110916 RepID=UPI003F7B721D
MQVSMQSLFKDKDELFTGIKKLVRSSGLTKWVEGKSCFVIFEDDGCVKYSLYGMGQLSIYMNRDMNEFDIFEFENIFCIIGSIEELSEYVAALTRFIKLFTTDYNVRIKKESEERIEEYKWFSDFYLILRGKFGKVLFSYIDLTFYIVECSTSIIIKKPMYYGAELVREFDQFTIIMDIKGFREKDVRDLIKEINQKEIFEKLNTKSLQRAFSADKGEEEWLLSRLIFNTFKNDRGMTNKKVIDMFKEHFEEPAFDILYTSVPLNFVVKNDLFNFKVRCYRSDYGCYMVDVEAAKITLKGTLSDIKQKIVNSVSQSEFKVVKA